MDKSHVIHQALISLDETYGTREEAITYIAQQAQQSGYVDDKDAFIEAVLARETEVSTVIGFGIAIPHGKTSAVTHPFIAFMRLAEPIQWSSDDEEQVRLIFLIGVPDFNAEALHLKFISQVSRKLLDEGFRTQLAELETTEEVFKLLGAIEV